MSGYLYFPNNIKDIDDHIQPYMISYKIFFQLMMTVFKENLNLQLPLLFYNSIRFAFETAFILGQIAELCQRLVTNLSPSLSLENFKTILYDFKKSGLVVLLERSQFVPVKVKDEPFRNGERYEDKAQCLLSPLQRKIGKVFLQKRFAWGNKRFWANIWGD